MVQTSHFWINREYIQDILRKGELDPCLEVKNCNVYIGTKTGDNYATIVFRASVAADTMNGPKHYKLILKCLPESEFGQKVIKDSGAFDREVSMYEDVFPEFLNFEKVKSVASSLLTSVPHCYFTQTKAGKELVVLEDLSPFGFKLADRRKGVDLLHCKIVMRELGKFHSLSFALKNENPKAFEINVKCMKDILYCEELREICGAVTLTGMNCVLLLVKRLSHLSRFIHKIETLRTTVFNIMNDLCQPKEPIAVLNQGDCWVNNILFRYEDEGDSQVPKEVKFLDFQLSRYGSPVLDILYFLFLSASKNIRDKHLEDLLRVYYQSFSESLKMLGGDLGKFTYEALRQETKEKYMFGIITGFTILPFITAEPDKVPDMNTTSQEAFFNEKDNPFYSRPEENKVLVSRIEEVLDEMEEKGYMDG